MNWITTSLRRTWEMWREWRLKSGKGLIALWYTVQNGRKRLRDTLKKLHWEHTWEMPRSHTSWTATDANKHLRSEERANHLNRQRPQVISSNTGIVQLTRRNKPTGLGFLYEQIWIKHKYSQRDGPQAVQTGIHVFTNSDWLGLNLTQVNIWHEKVR